MAVNLNEEELRKQFDEEFSKQLDDLLGIREAKPSHISISMIAKRNLSDSVSKGAQDELIEGLMKLTHVRLDRENVTEIDHLEFLGPVTNLYLQQNSIERIENLECMTSLQFLTLAGNKIRRIENLKILDSLKLLDLSENRIADLDADELPKSLAFLDLRNNPCTQSPDYRTQILAALPNLKQLDGEMLTSEEKRLAGHPVSSEEEEDDEETEEEEEQTGQADANIDDVFQLSADFIRQSRERTAQYLNQHQQHMHQIEEVRSQSRQAMMATPTATPMATARSEVTAAGSHGDDGSNRYLTPSPALR